MPFPLPWQSRVPASIIADWQMQNRQSTPIIDYRHGLVDISCITHPERREFSTELTSMPESHHLPKSLPCSISDQGPGCRSPAVGDRRPPSCRSGRIVPFVQPDASLHMMITSHQVIFSSTSFTWRRLQADMSHLHLKSKARN